MLDVWYGNFDSPFVYHPHWEQAALISMMTYSKWTVGFGVPPLECCELGMDPFKNCVESSSGVNLAKAARVLGAMHARVMFHPQRWMNSYPSALSNFIRDWDDKPAHTRYTPGDFIVSFSGCGFILGSSTCNALYDEYYDEAERRNA